MEILVEVLLALAQLLAEAFLQIILEALVELGLHGAREPFRRPRPLDPVLAAIGYAPHLLIKQDWLRILNLIITPVAAGAAMAALGAWHRRRNQELIRLDRFAYGFLFALAMALVRFVWGD